MGLVAAFVLSIFSAHAMNCRLPDRPVQDQDGLGSCYANTASLMMEHNLGLARTPSYFQLSLSASAHRGTRFIRDDKSKERPFNWGGHTCATFNQTKLDGYCDAETFRWDALDRNDAQSKQEQFLVDLGRLLENRGADLRRLLEAARGPAERDRLVRKLAGCFHQREEFCRESDDDFIARRFFYRLRESMTRELATLKAGPQKTALQNFMAQTFEGSGAPKPAAKDYFLREFVPRDRDWLKSLERLQTGNGLVAEDLFQVWWRNRLGMSGSFKSVGPANDFTFVRDLQARRVCAQDSSIAMSERLLGSCGEVPATLGPRFEAEARELLRVLEGALQPGSSGLRGFIGMMSPACEEQMGRRSGNVRGTCEEHAVTDARSKAAAVALAKAQLCVGNRSVGVALCTGFFKSPTPVDSKFCTSDTPGVENHGRHAVVLVGTRTGANGKTQFLVQNSWGRSCPFFQTRSEARRPVDALVECELSSNRSVTGRFWVDEDLLFNNTYQIQTIE